MSDKVEEKKEVNEGKKEQEESKRELTPEEIEKKQAVDLMVERLLEDNVEVSKSSLVLLCKEIKTTSSSMTSIPLALKFLKPYYQDIKAFYEKSTDAEFKNSLSDFLSFTAMTLANPEDRETLKFRLSCKEVDLETWGHEYVRHLSGELVQEYSNSIEEEKSVDNLLALVTKIVPFNMQHNAEPEACDLLLEVEKLEMILEYVDENNYNRVCLYLLGNADYAAEPEDTEILKVVLKIYNKLNKPADELVIAMKLFDIEQIKRIYKACQDKTMKKQLALLLGRNHIFSIATEEEEEEDEEEEEEDEISEEEEEFNEELLNLIGNTKLSMYFKTLGKDLDVLAPKLPEDIYKTHLLDSRYASNLLKHVDSAKQNLAATFVNAFVNCGFGDDKLVTVKGSEWLFKNKDEGKVSTVASLGLIYLWDANKCGALDKYTYPALGIHTKAGALLGIGLVCSGVHISHEPAFSLLEEEVTNPEPQIQICAILGLGIAYAGCASERLLEALLPVIENDDTPMDILGATSLALGLVYVGTGHEDIVEAIVNLLMCKEASVLEASTHTRFLSLGLGLLFLGKQEQAEVTIEALKALPGTIGKYAELTVDTCAYAGTGNVLKVQQLLHICGDHLEKDNEFQAVAVLGIALIAMGEEVGSEMAIRTFDHLLQYGELVTRKAVPLALALLTISNPQIAIVDTLSKLSHDSDADVSQGAILGLGLVGAGTNNSRIAGLLRQLSAYYSNNPNHLFMVRIAQGLLHLGKGTLSLNPFHTNNLLLSRPALAGILAVLHSALDFSGIFHGKYHYLLYMLTPAMHPRMLMTVNENMELLEVSARVGQAVDTVGQAGKPKTLTGFQTHTTPVLIGPKERAELATDEYIPLSKYMEGIVVLKPNPNYEKQEII